MRGDHNHTVLLLVEEDVFDRARDLADFGAVLEVVGETDRAAVAAEKEERVDVVDVRVLVYHQRAEDDLGDGSRARVLAHWSHASVRPPHADGAIDVT